jgi:hypothetical protein
LRAVSIAPGPGRAARAPSRSSGSEAHDAISAYSSTCSAPTSPSICLRGLVQRTSPLLGRWRRAGQYCPLARLSSVAWRCRETSIRRDTRQSKKRVGGSPTG